MASGRQGIFKILIDLIEELHGLYACKRVDDEAGSPLRHLCRLVAGIHVSLARLQ
jgi:hypothetical protein